ncbi:hypothetical protein BCJMU51_p1254 (plasmid) [Bacillus cereus]|uniref:DUF927 domain-containing protein n=6 Tax=Bacillus cereus group TaxID=86661 RepID=A0A1Y6A5J4_9BACI|nr:MULTISPECIES: hypothetical protein [Bacillus]MDV8115181.1 hypothetical protein [Bacillus sp. BAU-SS-2023]HDX9565318.1 hypothetical protein [Bacillus thuringiensis]AYF05388.1 hypothetical protein MLA2C4_06720 [Bacillus mobilis]MCT4485940.1 hypothetical protein [Bacillus sp. DN_7.5]MCT6909240.1 hypothetical protein [Bacillus cereus]
MDTIKTKKLYNNLESKRLERNEREAIFGISKDFKRIFKKHKINMSIRWNLDITGPNDQVINNFFIYPTHKIYYSNGREEKEVGLRIRIIKLNERLYDVFDIDLRTEVLEKADWLTSNIIDKRLRLNINSNLIKKYNKYLLVMREYAETKLKKKSKIIYTDQMGWIKCWGKWGYVPVTDSQSNSIIYDKNLLSKYKLKMNKDILPEKAFQDTMAMIDIADKKITIPLLAYTFLSVVTSLIKYSESSLNKFCICITGNNGDLNRVELANIFCNLYDRQPNIKSINAAFHSNGPCSIEEFRSMSSKIRDSVFIINTEKQNQKISMARKLLHNYNNENMFLLLNEDEINQDFILNLNISDIQVETSLLNQAKLNPESFTTCVAHFINFFAKVFSDIKKREKIRKELVKLYKGYQDFFNKDNVEYDINKIHMDSLLLVGFNLLLHYGSSIKVIDDKMIEHYHEEALQVFKHKSTTVFSMDTEHTKAKPIYFLEHLLQLLEENEPQDKNDSSLDHSNSVGWFESEEILYIPNNIFKRIEEIPNDNQQKISSSRVKSEIYGELYKNRVILQPDPDKEMKKIQVGTIEKTINVAKSSIKAFRMDWARAKEYIKEQKEK